MMDTSVFKLIHDEETNDSFRLSVEFMENDFSLTVFKKSSAWFAFIDYENICLQAKQLEIDTNEYLKKLQEYITNTPRNVSLIFNNKDFIMNCILENNMKVRYFMHRLEKVNYSDSAEMLLEKFYRQRNNSVEKFFIINKEKNELEESNNHLQLKLNEFIERKKTDEEELFSNFVLVLNEKKRRIQHLNELLEAFRRGRSSINPLVGSKKCSNKPEPAQKSVTAKEVISESDSEENYDTDEEKIKISEYVNKDFNHQEGAYAIPSTSKFSLFDDDSPPRHLPKRIKSDVTVDNNSYIKPSTSKQIPKHEKPTQKFENKTTDETPDINFSTQELLDNI